MRRKQTAEPRGARAWSRVAVAAAGLLALAAAEAAPAYASAGAAAAPAADQAVTCTYIVRTSWTGGFTADLVVTNNGPTIDGWTIRWTFPDPTTILGAWSSQISETSAGAVTATNASYNAQIATGRTMAIGWSASGLSTAAPTDITLNGAPC